MGTPQDVQDLEFRIRDLEARVLELESVVQPIRLIGSRTVDAVNTSEPPPISAVGRVFDVAALEPWGSQQL